MNDLNWNERFVPLNMADENDFSANSISLSVQNKLENEKGQITMTKKRIRPLMILAAAIATAAVSMISVNAATDGAITDAVGDTVTKIKMFINGEEVEADAHLVESGVDEEGNEYHVYTFDVDEDEADSVEIAIAEDDTVVNYDTELELSDDGSYETETDYTYDGESIDAVEAE